ncbi:nucleotide-binding protein [Bifidobacterium thermophilum]|uniref:CobQ/CobB/MinD/ParA nucleotide binding domain-containing protein n=1 Tax=Bifidobacterium thermophilum RBL67 TaxID=1254439 RepID=M4RF47_9BIFI|nr:hypothetical protein [Bifidobacterium thermophilum]AGH41183.1 hypothetical protein D805_0916 [Bifidobacterium thermophilum RBL67]MDW8486956.1 hypothetical protein [Bifidobacterium thermophilum]
MNHLAPVTFVTGGSGGLGKSTTARAIAHALGQRRMRTVLIDGNPGQQSQRAFLHIKTGGLEDAALDSIAGALIMPNRTHAAFALLPGPVDPMRNDLVGLYGSAITTLQTSSDIIIVDADRVGRDPMEHAQHVRRRSHAPHDRPRVGAHDIHHRLVRQST